MIPIITKNELDKFEDILNFFSLIYDKYGIDICIEIFGCEIDKEEFTEYKQKWQKVNEFK